MTESLDWKSIIWGRRSVRNFTDRAIPDEVLRSLLEAASQAPSAHSRQPWRFSMVRRSDLKEDLANALGMKLREDRLRDGDDVESVEQDVARSFQRIARAPVVILVSLTMEDKDRYPDEKRNQAEHQMAVQSVAMAGENLLLAAHAQGVGACWMCAPLFAPEAVSLILNLPGGWEPQGLVLLGYPAGPGKEKEPRKLEDMTQWD